MFDCLLFVLFSVQFFCFSSADVTIFKYQLLGSCVPCVGLGSNSPCTSGLVFSTS